MRNELNRLRQDVQRLRIRPHELRSVEQLTDRELWAFCRAAHPELPADLEAVPDEVLARIAGEGK